MLNFAKEMKTFTLGPFNPSVNIFHWLEFILNIHIPSNAHQLANGRLAVAATRMSDCKLTIISDFESKEDVINVSRFYRHTFKAKKKDKEGKNSHHFFPTMLSSGFTMQLLCARILRHDASILQRSGEYFYQRCFRRILFSAVSLAFDNVRWSSLTALCGRGFQQHAAVAARSLQPNPDSVSVLWGDGYLSRRHALHVGHGRQWKHTEGQRGQQHPDPQRSLPHDFRGKAQPFTTH